MFSGKADCARFTESPRVRAHKNILMTAHLTHIVRTAPLRHDVSPTHLREFAQCTVYAYSASRILLKLSLTH